MGLVDLLEGDLGAVPGPPEAVQPVHLLLGDVLGQAVRLAGAPRALSQLAWFPTAGRGRRKLPRPGRRQPGCRRETAEDRASVQPRQTTTRRTGASGPSFTYTPDWAGIRMTSPLSAHEYLTIPCPSCLWRCRRSCSSIVRSSDSVSAAPGLTLDSPVWCRGRRAFSPDFRLLRTGRSAGCRRAE